MTISRARGGEPASNHTRKEMYYFIADEEEEEKKVAKSFAGLLEIESAELPLAVVRPDSLCRFTEAIVVAKTPGGLG